MIKFFLTVVVAVVFYVLFFIQNSFTSLTPPTKGIAQSKANSPSETNSEGSGKKAGVTDVNKGLPQPIDEEASTNKANDTDTTKSASDKRLPEKGKESLQPQPLPPPDKPEKDILRDIKTTHGEVIIKKVKKEQSVTILTTEDKRVTGLQMSKNQTPAAGETYIDNKNTKAETGIQLPGNKQQPISVESYAPSHSAEPRY